MLPDAAWRTDPGIDQLVEALGGREGALRIVGGAVRDTIAGLPVTDIDLATTLNPTDVVKRLEAAGIKAVPTGIDHGTVTAVIDRKPYEVTTLRRDVATDGRRATVAFTDCWEEDAARRDFTINALYADPLTGEVFDYFGGLDDLASRRVRFIGDATTRIDEDHLRILRYFRFLARYGNNAPDTDAMAAILSRLGTLKALSRERVADELLKLLAIEEPSAAIEHMVSIGVFASIVPEIGADSATRLRDLIANERANGAKPDTIRRFMALLPRDPEAAVASAAKLRLPNKVQKRIADARAEPSGVACGPHIIRVAYRVGAEAVRDRALLDGDKNEAKATMAALDGWTPPIFPITGGMLVARGVAQGPDVSRTLRTIEDRWVALDFPDESVAHALMDQALAEALQ